MFMKSARTEFGRALRAWAIPRAARDRKTPGPIAALGAAGALLATAWTPACGGSRDATETASEVTGTATEAFFVAHGARGAHAHPSGASGSTGATGAFSSGASAASASARTSTMVIATRSSSSVAASSTAPSGGGARIDAAAFFFPATGDLGACPAMVDQLGFGACDLNHVNETCTNAAKTLCQCIRVDGEGSGGEIVCPAPGL
jgi:hypothetical protein